MVWPALIAAGGSLLGGLLGSRSEKKAAAQERSWALEDQAEQFIRLRDAAEKGGFNPLTALSVAPNSGMPRATEAASANYMGKAVAESSLILADSYARTQAAKEANKTQNLQSQNSKLAKKLTDATLRPKQPGIYDHASSNRVNRPMPRPSFGDKGTIPVFDAITGRQIDLDKRVADKLELNAWDIFDSEDSERILAEIGGEAYAATSLADAGMTQDYGTWGASIRIGPNKPKPWTPAPIPPSSYQKEGTLKLRNDRNRNYPYLWP